MRFWDGQHTVVAEGVRTQAHDRHRKRVAKGVNPRQTGKIVGDLGRETHRKNRNDGQSQEVETVGDHEGVPDGPVHAGPISPDVKGTEGSNLGRDVGFHVDGLPHKRLQVIERVPEVRGDTPSNIPQLPSRVDLVPSGHFGSKLCFLARPFLSVAVVSGGYQTRVVLYELSNDDVEISYLISTGSRYLAGGRSDYR